MSYRPSSADSRAKRAISQLRRLLGSDGEAARFARDVESDIEEMARDIRELENDRDRYKRRAKD
jgi:hypothetical protein